MSQSKNSDVMTEHCLQCYDCFFGYWDTDIDARCPSCGGHPMQTVYERYIVVELGNAGEQPSERGSIA